MEENHSGSPMRSPNLDAAFLSLVDPLDLVALAAPLHSATRPAVEEALALLQLALSMPEPSGGAAEHAEARTTQEFDVHYFYGVPGDELYCKQVGCTVDLKGHSFALCGYSTGSREVADKFSSGAALLRAAAKKLLSSGPSPPSHVAAATLINALELAARAEAEFSAGATWRSERRDAIRDWVRWMVLRSLRNALKRPYRQVGERA